MTDQKDDREFVERSICSIEYGLTDGEIYRLMEVAELGADHRSLRWLCTAALLRLDLKAAQERITELEKAERVAVSASLLVGRIRIALGFTGAMGPTEEEIMGAIATLNDASRERDALQAGVDAVRESAANWRDGLLVRDDMNAAIEEARENHDSRDNQPE